MSKELVDYKDAAEVVPEENWEAVYKNRPIFGALLSIALGIAMALLEGVITKILGGIVILAGLFVIFIYRAQKVLAFYKQGVAIYKDMDDSKAMYFPYRDIVSWSCKRSNYGTQHVVLMKKNKDYIYVETPELRSVKRTLRHYLPDKEFDYKKGMN